MHLEFDNGPIEVIVRCKGCERFLLLEMIDWAGHALQSRVYRVSRLDDEAVARFAHDVQRGYCDVNRVRNEWVALANSSQLTPRLIALDVDKEAVLGQRDVDLQTIPRAYWRDVVGAEQAWLRRVVG